MDSAEIYSGRLDFHYEKQRVLASLTLRNVANTLMKNDTTNPKKEATNSQKNQRRSQICHD
jgi:hypothetical protein